jgi:hypothetical protein
MEPIVCYTDTTTNDDGTVTAFCYCGWADDHDTQESADAAADSHQNAPDVIDVDYDETAHVTTA